MTCEPMRGIKVRDMAYPNPQALVGMLNTQL